MNILKMLNKDMTQDQYEYIKTCFYNQIINFNQDEKFNLIMKFNETVDEINKKYSEFNALTCVDEKGRIMNRHPLRKKCFFFFKLDPTEFYDKCNHIDINKKYKTRSGHSVYGLQYDSNLQDFRGYINKGKKQKDQIWTLWNLVGYNYPKYLKDDANNLVLDI